MRELLTFEWRGDIPRFKRVWDAGGCSATFAGASYLMIERGPDFSLFQLDPRDTGADLAKRVGTIWIKNSDMSPIEEASP